jgi:hypothetical protein
MVLKKNCFVPAEQLVARKINNCFSFQRSSGTFGALTFAPAVPPERLL